MNYIIYFICGPRQFLFTQCGPGKPKGWTPTLIDRDGEEHQSQEGPLGDTTHHRLHPDIALLTTTFWL